MIGFNSIMAYQRPTCAKAVTLKFTLLAATALMWTDQASAQQDVSVTTQQNINAPGGTASVEANVPQGSVDNMGGEGVTITPPTFTDLTSLDPNAPLDPMPEAAVAWPDMSQPIAQLPPSLSDEALAVAANRSNNLAGLPPLDVPQPSEVPGSGIAAPPVEMAETPSDNEPPAIMQDAATQRRYTVKVQGPAEIVNGAFQTRFSGLSKLDQADGDEANIAQINLRAREDQATLVQMLKTDGYYGNTVEVDIARTQNSEKITVTFNVKPGERFTYNQVDVTGLETTGNDAPQFRKAFGVDVGDPVDADDLKAAQATLQTDMQEHGYPFSKVGQEQVTVDHAITQGQLEQPVEPGGKRNFGKIVSDGDKPFGADHMQVIARFDDGDVYKASRVEDLRRALVATGLASSVEIKPIEANDPAKVDVAVSMTPAPPRTISGQLGYGTGEGFRAEVGWEHRNLFPPEGALLLRGVLGTREQLGSIRYRRNNFHQRDRILTVEALGSHLDRPGYDARTVSLSGFMERQSNLIFQKKWTWSVGAQVVATDERALVDALDTERRQTYVFAALPTSLYYDSTDDWLDPTNGFRAGMSISPEYSFKPERFPYVRAQLDGSYYMPIGESVVLAGRARYATIVGSNIGDLAPSRRYYAGGGGSVRGYAYQSIGASDVDGKPLGGKGLAELSLEARIRLRSIMGGNLGIVPFIDAGNVYSNPYPDLSGFQFGAGIGLRYYSMFGPIRVDVAMPINKRPEDGWVAVYVSLGQAF